MYLILEVLFIIPLKELKNRQKWLKIATAFAIFFAILTELIQHFFILNRYGEIMDFAANLLGTLVGYSVSEEENKYLT